MKGGKDGIERGGGGKEEGGEGEECSETRRPDELRSSLQK